MFAVTLICVGKLKEKFYLAASEEYAKRLRGYVDFTLIELPETRLPDDPSPAQIAQGLAKEAELIRARIPKGAWFCVLTPEGTQLSSEELAAALEVSRQTIGSLENGRYNPSILLAFKIARYFDVSIEEIFIYEEESI